MDRSEVTNEEFDKFVQATGYVTVAERTPTQEEFPPRRRRTLSPAQRCLLPLQIQCPSTTIFNGGVTKGGRIGVTRKARPAP